MIISPTTFDARRRPCLRHLAHSEFHIPRVGLNLRSLKIPPNLGMGIPNGMPPPKSSWFSTPKKATSTGAVSVAASSCLALNGQRHQQSLPGLNSARLSCRLRCSRSGEVQVRASRGSSGGTLGVASMGVRAENPGSKRVGGPCQSIRPRTLARNGTDLTTEAKAKRCRANQHHIVRWLTADGG